MTFEEACQKILAPLSRGSGTRHVWLGDTGMGKTTANRALIAYALETQAVQLVLTHDEKDPFEPQYPDATMRVNPGDLRNRPPVESEPRNHINFRGSAISRDFSQSVKPDEIAGMAWTIVRTSRCKILLNIDELSDALIPNSQIWDGAAMGAAYRKGRSVGITVVAGIQQPQLLPREAFGLAETIGLFRMDGREAAYLLQRKAITEDVANRLPGLQVGEFILTVKGERDVSNETVKVPFNGSDKPDVLPGEDDASNGSDRSVQPGMASGERVQVHSAPGKERSGGDRSPQGEMVPGEGNQE